MHKCYLCTDFALQRSWIILVDLMMTCVQSICTHYSSLPGRPFLGSGTLKKCCKKRVIFTQKGWPQTDPYFQNLDLRRWYKEKIIISYGSIRGFMPNSLKNLEWYLTHTIEYWKLWCQSQSITQQVEGAHHARHRSVGRFIGPLWKIFSQKLTPFISGYK